MLQPAYLMSATPPVIHAAPRPRYHVGFAQGANELRAVQQFRREILSDNFVLGPGHHQPGIDIDGYDAYCDHLVVRDITENRIVGVHRLLAPQAARRAGNYHSENSFTLDHLLPLRDQLVEIGRSCFAAEHCNSAVIALSWFKIAEYMQQHNHGYLLGCAPIPMRDGGHHAANLFLQLGDFYMAPKAHRVTPRTPLPYERLANDEIADVPPLVKSYLRAGAWICGEPAWNPDFNSADLPMFLPMTRLAMHYQRHPSMASHIRHQIARLA